MRRSFRTMARVTTALVAGAVVTFVAAYAATAGGGLQARRRLLRLDAADARRRLAGSRPRRLRAHDVRVGDVITFDDPYDKGRLVTHRVVADRPHEARPCLSHEGRRQRGARSVGDPARGQGRPRRVRRPARGLRALVRAHARGAQGVARSSPRLRARRRAPPDLAQRARRPAEARGCEAAGRLRLSEPRGGGALRALSAAAFTGSTAIAVGTRSRSTSLRTTSRSRL